MSVMLLMRTVIDTLRLAPRPFSNIELDQYAMLLKRQFAVGVLGAGDAMALNCIVQRHWTLVTEFDLPRGTERLGAFEYELAQSKISLMRAAMARRD